jgi:transcriptional regulator with XRE-family HTH domain
LEFARRLGITREHVSRIEAGAQPGTDVLRRVAEVTGTSLDFLVYGAGGALGETAAGAGSPDLGTSLGRLLDGTTLRLPQMSVARHRRTERAWRELPEERRNDVRGLVQRTGLVAVAIEGLFSVRVAKPVIDQLGEALATSLAD